MLSDPQIVTINFRSFCVIILLKNYSLSLTVWHVKWISIIDAILSQRIYVQALSAVCTVEGMPLLEKK